MKDSATIWKHVLREGICASNEVAKALCIPQAKATNTLLQLTRYGSLKQYDRAPDTEYLRYGVTKDCKVPQGVTVREITE